MCIYRVQTSRASSYKPLSTPLPSNPPHAQPPSISPCPSYHRLILSPQMKLISAVRVRPSREHLVRVQVFFQIYPQFFPQGFQVTQVFVVLSSVFNFCFDTYQYDSLMDCSVNRFRHRFLTLEDPHGGGVVVDPSGGTESCCNDGWGGDEIVGKGIV